MSKILPSRQTTEQLMEQYIKDEGLRNHCRMVAAAMGAYAKKLEEDSELWYQAGLLHDLDYEMYPDEHPLKAVQDLLGNYPEELVKAVRAHGWGYHAEIEKPATTMEKYLYACDEISGLMHAYSLMRPQGFEGMKAEKVRKKMQDKAFAAKINREDIAKGFELIEKEPAEHISFLIEVFKKQIGENR